MWIVQHFTLKSKLAVVKQEEEEEIDWMNRIEITDGICSLLYACHCTRPLVRLKGIICKHLHWGEGGGRYFQVFTALARFCVSPCCCWVGFGIWCLEPTFFAADLIKTQTPLLTPTLSLKQETVRRFGEIQSLSTLFPSSLSSRWPISSNGDVGSISNISLKPSYMYPPSATAGTKQDFQGNQNQRRTCQCSEIKILLTSTWQSMHCRVILRQICPQHYETPPLAPDWSAPAHLNI